MTCDHKGVDWRTSSAVNLAILRVCTCPRKVIGSSSEKSQNSISLYSFSQIKKTFLALCVHFICVGVNCQRKQMETPGGIYALRFDRILG